MDVVVSRGVAVSSREVVSICVVGTSVVVSIGAVVSKYLKSASIGFSVDDEVGSPELVEYEPSKDEDTEESS